MSTAFENKKDKQVKELENVSVFLFSLISNYCRSFRNKNHCQCGADIGVCHVIMLLSHPLIHVILTLRLPWGVKNIQMYISKDCLVAPACSDKTIMEQFVEHGVALLDLMIATGNQ